MVPFLIWHSTLINKGPIEHTLQNKLFSEIPLKHCNIQIDLWKWSTRPVQLVINNYDRIEEKWE